jgi:hypothetical protein
MPLATLLTITVLGIGGPPNVQPTRLANATIALSRHGRRLATSETGQLKARVKPGTYTAVAFLRDEPGKPPNFCEAKSVPVKRWRGRMSVTLRCSIK